MDDESKVMLRTIMEGLQINNARLEAFQNEVAVQFEKVDRRFEQMDKRFEEVDRRFEQMDRRFETVNEGIRSVKEELAIFTQDTNISNRRQDRRLKILENDLDLTIARVEALEAK